MKYVFREIIRILSSFSSICVLCRSNDNVKIAMIFLVIDDTVETIGQFLMKQERFTRYADFEYLMFEKNS